MASTSFFPSYLRIQIIAIGLVWARIYSLEASGPQPDLIGLEYRVILPPSNVTCLLFRNINSFFLVRKVRSLLSGVLF